MRLALLESLSIPSLAAQTDQNFHLMVLCSDEMPARAMKSLRSIIAAALPPERFSIVPAPYGWAHKHLTRFLKERYGQRASVIQTVLDDDDAFATNLVARIRQELLAAPEPDTSRRFNFLSFPLGYGLDLSSRDQGQFALYTHRAPYLNLGLTMISRSAGKNLFSIRHRKTPTETGGILAGGMPMFVRSLHDANDSRISVTRRWKPLTGWRTDPALAERFPFLQAFAA